MDINQPVDYYDQLYFNSSSLVGEFHRRRLLPILSAVPFGSTVLDLGCSSGLTSNLLAVKKCLVMGVDNRPECVEYAKKCSQNDFLIADARSLDLGKTFDVVVCSDVIEHFVKDERFRVLTVINRHLKPGGLLVVTVPGALSHLIEPLWKLWRGFKNPGVVFDDEGTHELVSAEEIKTNLGPNYIQIKSTPICLGLVHLLVMRKSC